ncbi:MAG: hypothetical protein ACKVZJ_09100 [Phycisphaerales bacterium]
MDPKRITSALTALCVVAGARATCGQSLNVDFGTPGTVPSSAYAGAGLAGAWNVIGAMPNSQVFPLVGLDGIGVAATVFCIGGSHLIENDIPSTAGSDQALLDDMFVSTNSPVDLCLFFRNLQPGWYEVISYAIDPDNAAGQNRLRADFAAPGPVWIGGAWPGQHAFGVTYARHFVQVSDGKLNPHSGEFGAQYRSGMNGIQLIYRGTCLLHADINRDNSVNTADLVEFLARFGFIGAAGGPGDLNFDGAVNTADLTEFLGQFGTGC